MSRSETSLLKLNIVFLMGLWVNNFATLFNCTPVGRASDNDGPDIKLSSNFVYKFKIIVGRAGFFISSDKLSYIANVLDITSI